MILIFINQQQVEGMTMGIGYFILLFMINFAALLNILMRKQEVKMMMMWYKGMGKYEETRDKRE